MTRRATILLLSATLAVTLTTLPGVSAAKSSRVASYSVERAWPTAVRFLRIDLGYKIIERDPEAGYIIFEMTKDDVTYRGSLEMVKTRDYAERDAAKLILEIDKQPDYEEVWVLEKMIERMREDLGQPIDREDPPPKKKKTPPKSDDKADGDGESTGDKSE